IGGTLLSGSALHAAEANVSVPVAAAPIMLVPEAYTAASVPVVSVVSRPSAPFLPTASPPSATAVTVASPLPETRLTLPPDPAIAVESRAVPAPVAKFDRYHPHWVVDPH